MAKRNSVQSLWPSQSERAQGRVAKRDAVLETAVDLFNERGFAATSLDDVAAKLGITKPTIYHYFENKEDILYECLKLGLKRIQAGLEYKRDDGCTAFEHLRTLLLLYAKSATSRFSICVTKTEDYDLSPENRQKFRQSRRRVDSAIRTMIIEGVEDGSIEVEDPRIASLAIAGALNTISRWFHAGAAYDEEQVAQKTVDFLMRSLEPRKPKGSNAKR